jgi:hypothetical protein
MRRSQAIIVILALLATPLALLARSLSLESAACTRSCCLLHGSHSGHNHSSSKDAQADGAMCPHGGAAKKCGCSMRSSHPEQDYGLLAPVSPTAPSVAAALAQPQVSGRNLISSSFTLAAGYLSAPFEPPRA